MSKSDSNSTSLSNEEILKKIANKEMPIYQIENFTDPDSAVKIRRSVIEQHSKVKLEHIGTTAFDYARIMGRNAENVIGTVSIPLGVAGPLKINGEFAKDEFYVPMATTEGALIASVSRGAKAANKSGGVTVRIIEDGMTRGPVFSFDSIIDVQRFLKWLPENYEKIRGAAEETTDHGKLKSIKPLVNGNDVFLRFRYSTGDAMGMNMVTVATEAACTYIEKNFKGARLIAVSGNVCSDKKQSHMNSIEGRGKTAIAEATIKESVLNEVFNATAEAVNEVNYVKNWIGSARAGSAIQFNSHFANIVAAVFLATGQDPAQVVESSSGYTTTKVRGKDLYITVTLPSLEVGTIGGGTGLATQRESLTILGAAGPGSADGENSKKLAEIIAATVLCGELNLLSALAGRELGKAHQKLGRNKVD
ncbi:MAG: hydroxymethylglutaryl-CoA reductase (NADPH) [Candidatus Micrarchaeota archaeon]|nr:hydroxymethylglutaryl-CoA reductase (NADPH) [Candidatus Micrarchaeota archaeon]